MGTRKAVMHRPALQPCAEWTLSEVTLSRADEWVLVHDYWSRVILAVNPSSHVLRTFLDCLIRRFGRPDALHLDKTLSFSHEVLLDWCRLRNITLVLGPSPRNIHSHREPTMHPISRLLDRASTALDADESVSTIS